VNAPRIPCRHAASGGAGRAIIAKDDDFLNLSLRHTPVVRLIWVRAGNRSTNRLIERFSEAWPQMRTALPPSEAIVEQRQTRMIRLAAPPGR
jgi:predicted nuclease of predicted toxin-antitoxin system